MNVNRPDLSQASPEVRAYIEALERDLERLESELERAELDAQRENGPKTRVRAEGSPAPASSGGPRAGRAERLPAEPAEVSEPAEPPTTRNVITISAAGLAKRTPRHLYGRQRRGGMGIFDLESPDNDPPRFLTVADESQNLVFVSSLGRAFRLPVRELPESPVRARGIPLAQRLNLRSDERLGVVFPDSGGTYLVLVTERGQVRRIRHHYFGDSLLPGTLLYDIKEGGAPAATCWTAGEGELFIATKQGLAIRFSERLVPVRGCLGIRVDPGDVVAGVAGVPANGSVFMLGNDGKGTIRAMETFAANKAPGSGGKVALKTERLVGATAVAGDDDLFIVSKLGKLIRFRADEVPPKEGAVQGVNCMALRADETTALIASPIAAKA